MSRTSKRVLDERKAAAKRADEERKIMEARIAAGTVDIVRYDENFVVDVLTENAPRDCILDVPPHPLEPLMRERLKQLTGGAPPSDAQFREACQLASLDLLASPAGRDDALRKWLVEGLRPQDKKQKQASEDRTFIWFVDMTKRYLHEQRGLTMPEAEAVIAESQGLEVSGLRQRYWRARRRLGKGLTKNPFDCQ